MNNLKAYERNLLCFSLQDTEHILVENPTVFCCSVLFLNHNFISYCSFVARIFYAIDKLVQRSPITFVDNEDGQMIM